MWGIWDEMQSSEITITDVLIDLRRQFPGARALMFNPVTAKRLEMPLFVAHYFPDEMPAKGQAPWDFVIEHDKASVRSYAERSTTMLAAQTPPVELHDGTNAVCAIFRLDELAASIALFIEPSAIQLLIQDRAPTYLLSIGSMHLSPDGTVVSSDWEVASMMATRVDSVGRNFYELVSPALAQIVKDAMVEIDHNPTSIVQFEGHVSSESGGHALRLELAMSADGQTRELSVARREHRLGLPQELRTDQEFRTLAETLPVGVFVLGRMGLLTFANQTLKEIYGVERMEGFDWIEAVHPDDRPLLENAIVRLRIDRSIDTKIRLLTPEGDTRWCRIAARDLRDDNGSLDSVVGLVEDITEIRSLQNKLERQASTDALTSLPNRATLLEHLSESLLTGASQPGYTAVLFIDLDGFKLINDTQGHSVGDVLLKTVARRFAESLRPGDLIARFGGDEFVVVARNVDSESIANAVARRLHDVLAEPIFVHSQPLTMTASIGIALSHNQAAQAEDLLADADLAMYEAKRLGRRRSVLYDNGLREAASQRFDITTDLRHARSRHELRAEYQPIYDLASGLPHGAEALIRWDHPAHGLLMPGAFIELAEESGLITDIGDWIVEQACSDLARLRLSGLASPDFFITINISTMQLSHVNGLAATARRALQTHGLQPRDIVFELTESIPVDAIPEAAEQVRTLKNLGFRLAIDDFGTGYSSLEYLTMLPFDILKTDPTFTQRLASSESGTAVLESIIVMARRLDFSIIAEGIETDAQRTSAFSAGVQYGQGYFYCRPQPVDRLIEIFSAV